MTKNTEENTQIYINHYFFNLVTRKDFLDIKESDLIFIH